MKSTAGWVLLAIIIVAGIYVVLPVAIVIGQMMYMTSVPRSSAELRVPQANAVIRFELYVQDPFMGGPLDRYLIVKAPGASAKQKMNWIWRREERTSLYLTETNDVVVLGPANDDYLVRFKPLRISDTFDLPSERWTYLGVFAPDRAEGGSALRYFSPREQKECIPMGEDNRPGRHRPNVYSTQCSN